MEYARRSKVTPDFLKDIPKLLDENEDVWAMYLDLRKRGPINYSEIEAYSKLAKIRGPEALVKMNILLDVAESYKVKHG